MPRFSGTPVKSPRFSGAPVGRKSVREAAQEQWESGSTGIDVIDEYVPQGVSDFMSGVGRSAKETLYGARDLLSEETGRERTPGVLKLKRALALSDADRADLERQKSVTGGAATAGRIAGDVAQIAAPGGVLGKGLKAAGMARGATALGDIAASAGHGYIKAPDEEETRAENALWEAGAAAAGAGVAGALAKTLRGANKLPAAQAMLDKGRAIPGGPSSTYLSPGQAASSKLLRGAENIMEVTPFLARGTKAAKEAAKVGWVDDAIQSAAPAGTKITAKGTEAVKQLSDAFRAGYKSAWGTASPVSHKTVRDSIDLASEAAPRVVKKQRRVLKNVVDELKTVRQSGSTEAIETLDRQLRDEIGRAAKKGDTYLLNALRGIRGNLRSHLSDAGKSAMKALDSKYGEYKAVEAAADLARKEGGVFTPSRLMQGARSAAGRARTARGEAPLQETAQQGIDVLEGTVGGQPLEWFRRVAAVSPSPPGMRLAGKAVMGETALQRAAQRGLDNPYAQALRMMGLRGAPIGGALEE